MEYVVLFVIIILICILFIYYGGIFDSVSHYIINGVYKNGTCFENRVTPEEENILYELLDMWKDAANKFNIRWSACAGTLLGAYRNQGRIPWDDDMDVTVGIDDISKIPAILKYLKTKYGVSYTLNNKPTMKIYKIFFPKRI